ncbi:MAG: hypothetical protein GY722_19945 [bacterium]|nr:hypothetical protein [bacterium]
MPRFLTHSLPAIGTADCIKIRAKGHDAPVLVADPPTITKVTDFANLHLDGWKGSFAIAPVDIEFFHKREFIGRLGIADQFITRNYGNFFAKDLPSSDVLRFASSTHPALYEGIYPVIPPGIPKDDLIREAKSRLHGISLGASITSIYEHISDVGGRITADYPAFINTAFVTLNVGEYADTVIAGQYRLDEKRNLTKRRYLGISIVGKHPRPTSMESKDCDQQAVNAD